MKFQLDPYKLLPNTGGNFLQSKQRRNDLLDTTFDLLAEGRTRAGALPIHWIPLIVQSRGVILKELQWTHDGAIVIVGSQRFIADVGQLHLSPVEVSLDNVFNVALNFQNLQYNIIG